MNRKLKDLLANRGEAFQRLALDMGLSPATLLSYLNGKRKITPWAKHCLNLWSRGKPLPVINWDRVPQEADETRKIRGEFVEDMLQKTGVNRTTWDKARRGIPVRLSVLWQLHLYSRGFLR